jgi:hypothetical protein
MYELLFTGIKNQPASVFDFDIRRSVLGVLTQPVLKPSPDRKLIFVIIGVSMLFIIAVWFILNQYLPSVFSVSNTILIYMFLTTIFSIFVFQVADIFRNYQNKIKSLDFL